MIFPHEKESTTFSFKVNRVDGNERKRIAFGQTEIVVLGRPSYMCVCCIVFRLSRCKIVIAVLLSRATTTTTTTTQKVKTSPLHRAAMTVTIRTGFGWLSIFYFFKPHAGENKQAPNRI
jgi:hypothetical protein